MIEGRINDKGYKAASSNNSDDKKCNVMQYDIRYGKFVNCSLVI